jgi:hypothetical protein
MLRKLLSGFTQAPHVSALEAFFSRVLLSMLVAWDLQRFDQMSRQENPVGLARFFDLTWLSHPEVYPLYRNIVYGLLILFIAGIGLPFVLPLIALGHTLVWTLYNSQGSTHHGHQIISMLLVVQAGVVIYYQLKKQRCLLQPTAELNGWLLWHSIALICGTYVVSVITKMDNSNGMWFWNSNHIAMDMLKTQRQNYLNDLSPEFAGDPPLALWLIEHKWIARAMFSSGVLLELFCFFALGHRLLAFIIGLSLIAMHRSISHLMNLEFLNNELLALIFFVNIPFLIAWPLEWVWRKMRDRKASL